jgi:hypothetical protein
MSRSNAVLLGLSVSTLLTEPSSAWTSGLAPSRKTRVTSAPAAVSTTQRLLTRPSTTNAFMPRIIGRRLTPLSALSFDGSNDSDPPEEEDPCEEECEIDWSQMPDWGDETTSNDNNNNNTNDNTGSTTPTQPEESTVSAATTTYTPRVILEEFLEDFQPWIPPEELLLDEEEEEEEYDDAGLTAIEARRVCLEMTWQLTEECNIEKPQFCGQSACASCHGQGRSPCRFCHGHCVMYLGDRFLACNVCEAGLERCKACQGTGRIAGFTQIPLKMA